MVIGVCLLESSFGFCFLVSVSWLEFGYFGFDGFWFGILWLLLPWQK